MFLLVHGNPFRFREGFFIFLLFLSPFRGDGQQRIGHSHNDYRQRHPLLSAQSAQMVSVEADVHLINGELYVSHLRPLIRRRRKTLRSLYLEPLFKQHQAGALSESNEPLMLMIDIKTDAEATYAVLIKQLADYQPMLVRWSGHQRQEGAVMVLISGNRPVEQIMGDPDRLVAIDGRLNDRYTELDAALMPVISLPAQRLKHYRRWGAISAELYDEVKQLNEMALASGKRLRVWGVRDDQHHWALFLKAGITLINTDKPQALRNFVNQHGYTETNGHQH